MNIRNRIILGISLLLVVLAVGTIGYWYISGNFLDSLYMTVITAGTVGYGEIIDLSHSPGGRVFTIVFIVLSLVTIAVITSLLAASILEIELTGSLRRRKMNKDISKLSDHYIICGAGENGRHVIQELAKTLHPFVVIDVDQEALEKLAAAIPNLLYIKGDATDDESLLAAGVERALGVVTVLPSDKDNLYVTVMTKQYNSKVRVVALGVEDKAINKLKKVGADSVVAPSAIGGLRMASEMVRPYAVKFLDTMLRQTERTFRIEEIIVRKNASIIGKKLAETPFRDKFGLLILAVMRPDTDEIVYNPPADTILKEGNIVVALGDVAKIKGAAEFIHS
ncbi:MAG: potassium channel protein [Planctomycetes bacterium]|nr:potassium channel protein [Planctomycetota bacterium]